MSKLNNPGANRTELRVETMTPKEVCNLFNERLRLLIADMNNDYSPIELGMPSEPLLISGIPYLPIQMTVQRLVDKKLQSNHPFSLVSVVHMPEYLANPIAVFQSKTRGDSKVIFTEMQDNRVNMVIAVELNKFKGRQCVNDVRSVYPKDNILDVLRWIALDGLLEYCNKQKILNWLSKQQSNSAEVTKLIKDCTNIVQKT